MTQKLLIISLPLALIIHFFYFYLQLSLSDLVSIETMKNASFLKNHGNLSTALYS